MNRSLVALVAVVVAFLVFLLLRDRAPGGGEGPSGRDDVTAEGATDAPPALAGTGRPHTTPAAEVDPPRIEAPVLDPARTRGRLVRVRVEGDLGAKDAVEVAVLDAHGSRVATASFTGPREVAFPLLPWADYAVVARAGERLGSRPAVWDDTTVVPLEPGRLLRGTAKVHGGARLAGVSIRLHPEPLPSWGFYGDAPRTPPLALSDERGRFEILVPRSQGDRPTWLTCRHPLYAGVLKAVAPGIGPAEVVVRLGYTTDVVVSLHVVGEDGRDLVPRVRWSERTELGIHPEPTSARFDLAWPGRSGEIRLFVRAEGHETVEVERPADPTRIVQVVLPEKPWAEVRVRDANGIGVPVAQVVLMEEARRYAQWVHGAWTDGMGDVRIPAPVRPAFLQVASPGFATAFVALEAGQVDIPVLLPKDEPPVVVLPEGLPCRGSVHVTLETVEGLALWQRSFALVARETPLPGLPNGPKHAEVSLSGLFVLPGVAFEAEKRIEVPRPGDWPGLADVTVEIEGGGDLEGTRTEVREVGAKARSVGRPLVEGGVVTLTVLRGRSYELLLSSIDKTLRHPFEVGLEEEAVETRWRLPQDAPSFVRWHPRILDEETGEPLGGGFLEVLDVDSLGNTGNRRYARIDQGRASAHVVRERRQMARVVLPGFAETSLGPMPGTELAAVETIRLPRPLRLRVTWPAEEKVRVFAFDAKVLARPSPVNLFARTARGGTFEIQTGRSTAYVVWAVGSRWARPTRIAPGTEHVELALETPSGVEVRLPEDVEATETRLWIEYREVNVGYSSRGQWRPLPYHAAVATPGEVRDGIPRATLDRCPAGACTVKVGVGDDLLLEKDVVLPPGETLHLVAE